MIISSTFPSFPGGDYGPLLTRASALSHTAIGLSPTASGPAGRTKKTVARQHYLTTAF